MLHPRDGSGVLLGLVNLEEAEFRLGDDGVVEGLEVAEEFVDVFGVDVDCDLEGDAVGGGHVDGPRLLRLGRSYDGLLSVV